MSREQRDYQSTAGPVHLTLLMCLRNNVYCLGYVKLFDDNSWVLKDSSWFFNVIERHLNIFCIKVFVNICVCYLDFGKDNLVT